MKTEVMCLSDHRFFGLHCTVQKRAVCEILKCKPKVSPQCAELQGEVSKSTFFQAQIEVFYTSYKLIVHFQKQKRLTVFVIFNINFSR